MKLSDLTSKVVGAIVGTSIWRPASVTQEPNTKLTQWRVYQAIDFTLVSTHFVGYAGYAGRVCSAIQSYDKRTKCGITKSGRIYELVGPSGYNQDAMYVFSDWCARFPRDTIFKDITDTWA